MNRANILRRMKDFLAGEGHKTNIIEFLIEPQALGENHIRQRRSVVIVGEASLAPVKDLLVKIGLNIPEGNLRLYPTLDDLENSDLVDTKDYSLENNWRGRILRLGKEFDYNLSAEDLRAIFLDSFWRLIISRYDGEFFSKRNIHPVFYNPADSIGGIDSFIPGIHSFIKFITESRFLDPDFDKVVFFGVKRSSYSTSAPYEVLKPLGKDKTPMIYIETKLQADRAATISLIEDAYKKYFTT